VDVAGENCYVWVSVNTQRMARFGLNEPGAQFAL